MPQLELEFSNFASGTSNKFNSKSFAHLEETMSQSIEMKEESWLQSKPIKRGNISSSLTNLKCSPSQSYEERPIKKETIAYNLKCSRCHKHAQSSRPCKLTSTGNFIPVTVYGSRENFIFQSPEMYCGNVKSKPFDLIHQLRKIKINHDEYDYIKLPFDIIFINTRIITHTLYITLNDWSLTKPGTGVGGWEKKLREKHEEVIREYGQQNNLEFDKLKNEKQAANNIISRYFLQFIYEDLYWKNWLPHRQLLKKLHYKMGGDALLYDWTFSSVDNVFSVWDSTYNDEDDEISEEKEENNQEEQPNLFDDKDLDDMKQPQMQIQKIKLAWFLVGNAFEFPLTLKPTPKASEKHEFCVPDLTTDVESILRESERQITRLILKSDGLRANIGVPEKIINDLIEEHGPIFKGNQWKYDLRKFLPCIKVCIYI